MAKNLDFKMRLQGENASAKKAINEVKQELNTVSRTEVKPRMNFSDFAKANVEMQSMGLASGKLAEALNKVTVNSGKASQVLMTAFDAKSPEKLVAALERGTASLNRMKDGARIAGGELSASLNRALPVINSLESRSKSLQATLNNMRIAGATEQSIKQIEQELFRVDSQAKRASAAFNQFGLAANQAMARADASIKNANGSISGLTQNLTRSQSAFAKMQQDVAGINAKITPASSSIASIGQGFAKWAVPAALLSSVGILGKELLDVQLKANRIAGIFNHSFGKNAGNEVAYVSEKARELGVNFEALRENYGKFSVSAKEANFTTAETRSMFEGIVKAGGALGMTADEVNGSFLAISQIASKGNVSLEELRGQLGERIPGAMSLAAKAMGVTTSELEKMIEKGLSANEFLPKFAKVLNETFSGSSAKMANSLNAEVERLNQSWLELKESAAGGLFNDAAAFGTSMLTSFVENIKSTSNAVKTLFETTADKASENAAVSSQVFAKHAANLAEAKKTAEKQALDDTKKAFEDANKAAQDAANKTIEMQKAFSENSNDQTKVALINAQTAEDAAFKTAEAARAAWAATGNAAKEELEKLPTQVSLASEAFKKFNLDINSAMGRVSTSTQEAISSFDELSVAVDRVGGTAEEKSRALSQAFNQIIDGAKTQADFEAVRSKIEQMGRQGVLSSSDMRAALDSVSERAGKLAGETDKVTQAFERMGLKTNEELAKAAQQAQGDYELIKNSGKASAETIEAAYKQAAEAAKRSGNDSALAWADAEAQNIKLSESYSTVGTAAEEYGYKADEANQRAGRNADYVIKQNRRIEKSYQDVADAQQTRNDNPYSDDYGKLQNHQPMESGKTSGMFVKNTYSQAYSQAQSLGLVGKEIDDYIRKALEEGTKTRSNALAKSGTWGRSVTDWRSADVPEEFGGGKGIYELKSVELQKYAEQLLSTRRAREQSSALAEAYNPVAPVPTQDPAKSVNLNLQLGDKSVSSTVNGTDVNALNDLVKSLERANALKG